MSEPLKQYLGDSVYVAEGKFRGQIVLTTENGLPDDLSNTIYIELEMIKSLVEFGSRLLLKYAEEDANAKKPSTG